MIEAAGLHACRQLLAGHLAAAARRFGSAALGLVDLPPLGHEPVVVAQAEVAAVLYWCRQVDRAGLPSFVEALAARLARGELDLDLGAAAHRLAQIWRTRQQRFNEGERRGLFQRLFDGAGVDPSAGVWPPVSPSPPAGGGASAPGPPPGEPAPSSPSSAVSAIDRDLRALASLLAELGRRRADDGVADLEARVATVGGDLARKLSDRATGIAGFAAREIVSQIREAVAVLQAPDVARALGGGTPYAILQRWGPRILGRPLEVMRDFERAESGLYLLRWLAHRGGHGAAIARRDPVVAAAERWLATASEAS